MARALLWASLTAVATDLMKVFFFVNKVPPEQKGALLMEGCGESLSPLVMGFAFLFLTHLLTALGQRRLDARRA
jgi:hypothetical protein